MEPKAKGEFLKEVSMEIERYHGRITKVGEVTVMALALPDWDLVYIEFPPGQMVEYRRALMRTDARLTMVTDERIYFEQS